MSTIIVYRTKKRLVKSGKDRCQFCKFFSQLGKNYFPVRKKIFPNQGKTGRFYSRDECKSLSGEVSPQASEYKRIVVNDGYADYTDEADERGFNY